MPLFDPEVFRDPPAQYRGWTMWEMDLTKISTPEAAVQAVRGLADAGYGGFFIVVSHASGKNLDPDFVSQGKQFYQLTDGGVEYLSEEFFGIYRAAIEEGRKLGLNVILYDDYFFPTGQVCGQLYTQQPQHMAKRLDMVARDVAGPAQVEVPVPAGTYLGAVLMNTSTLERVDVSDRRTADGRLVVDVPAGPWRAMAFYLDTDAVLHVRNPGIVDYLDAAAADAFLSLSYDKFYAALKDYFGPVVKMAFYDEPVMHWLGGRTWTAGISRILEERLGRCPITLYPALWYDIGPETAAARNTLFGLRAELFQAFFTKLDAWCTRHDIQLTGHMDQEEVPNPVPINGDLMKLFEHQAVPGADDVFWWGRANRGYKVVTSASFNYDKPVTMAETYAAYEKVDESILLKVAMDQFAFGINFQFPTAGIETRAANVPDLNRLTGRLSYMLQGGRHVADVAILYPIAALQACYVFKEPLSRLDGCVQSAEANPWDNWEYGYTGGILPPEIDYMDVGERLFFGLRMDYTYLHPEVLERRCAMRGDRLVLDNKVNREEYRVLILPGGDTLHAATARKIRAFYEQGGTVVATSRLPFRSAEFGRDGEVQEAMEAVFEVPVAATAGGALTVAASAGYHMVWNDAGGRAYFLPKPDLQVLDAVLRQVIPVRDVEFREPMWPLKQERAYEGALSYLHKVQAGRDVYYFANSSDRRVDTEVVLRGEHTLQVWDPHTGATAACQAKHSAVNGTAVTTVPLVLPPVASLLYVEEARREAGRKR